MFFTFQSSTEQQYNIKLKIQVVIMTYHWVTSAKYCPESVNGMILLPCLHSRHYKQESLSIHLLVLDIGSLLLITNPLYRYIYNWWSLNKLDHILSHTLNPRTQMTYIRSLLNCTCTIRLLCVYILFCSIFLSFLSMYSSPTYKAYPSVMKRCPYKKGELSLGGIFTVSVNLKS